MPFFPIFPSVPLQETDLFSFFFARKDRPFPDDKILYQDVDTLTTYTYADVRSLSISFGEALKARLGFKAGDTLVLVAPNNIDTAPVVLGTSYAGGIVSPANPSYTVPELAFQLSNSKARFIVTHPSTLPTVLAAAKEAGIPSSMILALGSETAPAKGIKHWKTLLSPSTPPANPTRVPHPKTTPALLPYSSGTTGRPKAVMLSHHNLTSNVLQVLSGESYLSWNGGPANTVSDIPPAPSASYSAPNTGGDRVLAVLPFFHIYGLMVHIFLPLYQGTHTLVLPRFELERFCQLIQDHKVTYAYIVPPMALGLSKHPVVAKYDLSSLRMTNSAAAPLGAELVEAVWKKRGIRVKQTYGLSETSPGITQQGWGDWWSARGTVGRLNANQEAKLCEVGEPGAGARPAGKEVAAGEVGELYVKGPNVFMGYLGNETATRECLSEDGWFRTGDVGYVDGEGNIFITDRVKELIKYKGFQVAPAELEGVLLECEIVDDVAVVGVWDEANATEIPRAWVVRKGGMGSVTAGCEAAVVKYLQERAAGYKWLRGGVRFVEAVPKSASGKILRRVLKDEAKKEEMERKRATRAKL